MYIFEINDVTPEILTEKQAEITKAGLTITQNVNTDTEKSGTITGQVSGHTIGLTYDWKNNNLTIGITQKPMLASNSLVEGKVHTWFAPTSA